jgi:hypothetical protein
MTCFCGSNFEDPGCFASHVVGCCFEDAASGRMPSPGQKSLVWVHCWCGEYFARSSLSSGSFGLHLRQSGDNVLMHFLLSKLDAT